MNIMLKQLASILTASTDDGNDPVMQLVESLGKSVAKGVEIEVSLDGEKPIVRQVILAALDAERPSKYLFRKGPPFGTGPTSTYGVSKPSKADKRTPGECAESVFQKKFLAYLKEMANDVNSSINEFGKACLLAIENDLEKTAARVVELAEQIAPTKESAILTLVIVDADGQRKYPAEIAPLRDYFYARANPDTKKESDSDSVGANAICSCCGEFYERVRLAPAQTLGYFTIDKPGFIAGGFQKKTAWRNFTLCAECILGIRKGHLAAFTHLQFTLCKTTYLLLPNFTDWQGAATTVVKNIAAWRKAADPEAQREQEILFARRLAREEALASLTYLFFRKKPTSSRVEILCSIEGILPSRLAEVAETADRATEHPLLASFGQWTNVPQLGAIPVNFTLIRDLYQPHTEGKKDPLSSDFLRAIQRLIYGQPFDAAEFFDAALTHIRQDLRTQQHNGKEPWLALSTHRALALALWLAHLGLINFAPPSDNQLTSKGGSMPEYPKLNAENLNEQFDEFFQSFGGLFANPAQRACYLMGVLCAQVLSEQRKRYDNRQPFFRNLKDLNLNEPEMRDLLRKIKSKLVEYDIDHFSWGLEQAVAERFRLASSPWRMPNSEINFFFTLGLCEARLFSPKANNQTSNPTEEQKS